MYAYQLSPAARVRLSLPTQSQSVTDDRRVQQQSYASSSSRDEKTISSDPYVVVAGDTSRIEALELERIPFSLRKNQSLYRSHLQMLRAVVSNTVRTNESGRMLPYEFATIENEIRYLFSEIDSYHTYLYMVEVYPSQDNLTLLRNQKASVRQSIERLQIASNGHIIIPNTIISHDFR